MSIYDFDEIMKKDFFNFIKHNKSNSKFSIISIFENPLNYFVDKY